MDSQQQTDVIEQNVTVPPAVDDLPLSRFVDRELSWLAFNQRVLELAEDERTPLLERTNFLAIFASNLDEFFMVRIAGLKRRILTGLAVPTPDGTPPEVILEQIQTQARELQVRHARTYLDSVAPSLKQENIHIVNWEDLSREERGHLHDVFDEQIFPVLMPLAVDPAHPFPYISGLSLNLSVRVNNPVSGKIEFARLKVPTVLPRLYPLQSVSNESRFIPLEDLITHHLDKVFVGMEILDFHAFRLTRNEDVTIEEDETENLLQALEQELLRRRFGPPIRLEVSDDMDDETLELLTTELDITRNEVSVLPGPLDLRGLFELGKVRRPDLKFAKHVPVTPADFRTTGSDEQADIFGAVATHDVLAHHPYESFSTSVQA
ncbi:MAG: RNA degradosome polyphosphate kinase, partial [Pseudoclavibacter sp.]